MVYIIAEAGVDHEGSSVRMEQLADICFKSGADALKIQWFQKCLRGPTRELPWIGPDVINNLVISCIEKGTDFIITPHDDWAINHIGNNKWPLDYVKIGSGGWHLIEHARTLDVPLIISTGMKTHEEVQGLAMRPGDMILHCVSEYPCPAHRANLPYIAMLQHMLSQLPEDFQCKAGYSDHCAGPNIALASLPIGDILEKHICLEKDIEGRQDTFCALDKEEFIKFVSDAREIDLALTAREKVPTEGEVETAKWLNQRLVH
jgi:N,N'-diacetyllegionaminate synthase|tara:strand:- start:12462 stop:13244 length:783 start_codon:yes stop_codon:yes gene_type:complete